MKKLMAKVHLFIDLCKSFSDFFRYFSKAIEKLWFFGLFRKKYLP